MRTGMGAFVTAAGLLATPLASAEGVSTDQHHHHDNTIAVHFRSVDSFSEGEHLALMGPAALYGHTLVEDWLEVELGAAALFGEEGHRAYPVEVLFKMPFHLLPEITSYMGAGPSLVVHSEQAHHGVSPGGVVCAGTHFWSGARVGVVVEVGIGLVAEEEEMVRELEGNTGVVVSF